MTKIKSMCKIVAVSVMSMLVGISFNGCGFFSNTYKPSKIKAESCDGEGMVTMRGNVTYGNYFILTIDEGECKNGLKEGLWKYYAANDSSLIQEVNFVGGIRNGTTIGITDTIEYYTNGKKVAERQGNNLRDLYLYYDEYDYGIKSWRKYDIQSLLSKHKQEYYKKVNEIENKNAQIEYYNKETQREANAKYEEAKARAQEIAKQRAKSKVKKPTMQEKKSKNAMDIYRANLQAQMEKELQIELSKIQAPQVAQTIEIPPYKEPKLDTYEEILAFVKDKKHTIEEFAKSYNIEIASKQDYDDGNFESEIEYISHNRAQKCWITNNTYKGDGCLDLKSNDSFKEIIEKSMFKDKLNAILP